jgi:hypothetical protein
MFWCWGELQAARLRSLRLRPVNSKFGSEKGKVKRKKLGYQEGFQDYAVRFGCGSIVGVLFAFAALTRFGIENKKTLIWIIIGCGLFASIAWKGFWNLIEEIANFRRWPF